MLTIRPGNGELEPEGGLLEPDAEDAAALEAAKNILAKA